MPTAFNALVLCIPADVYKRVNRDGVLQLIGTTQSAQDGVVQTMIDLTQDLIRQRLVKLFKDSYPNTIERWKAFENYAVERTQSLAHQELRSRGVENILPEHISGLTVEDDFIRTALRSRPAVHVNFGTPTSETLAGSADNGDVLIDTDNWRLYQNTGTKSAPVWTAWDVRGFLDCILNPGELKRACVTGTILALYENGSLIDNGNFAENIKAFEDTKKRLTKQFNDELELAITNLDIDISGDGVISDFERERVGDFDCGFS